MLDGEVVNNGDAVFVLGIGYGKVVSVSVDGSFRVKTGNSIQEFRSGGYIGNVRRVYWHDPVFVIPPKSASLWALFKEQSLYNYDIVRKVLQGGGSVPEETAEEE